MKRLLQSLLLCALPVALTAQTHIVWDAPVEVADAATYGWYYPRIALNAQDAPVLVWTNHADHAVWTARWTGSGFSTPVSLLPAGMEAYATTVDGPSITAQGDTLLVSLTSQPINEAEAYVVRSVDGGSTWSDTLRVSQTGTDIPFLASVYGGDPGQFYVLFMRQDAQWNDPRYVISRSTDAGLTWAADVNATALVAGDVCDCCMADAAVAGQEVAVVFRNNTNNLRDVRATLSTDGGSSFGADTDLDASNWVYPSCPSSGPQVHFTGDSLHAFWMSRATGSTRLYQNAISRSTQQAGSTRMVWTSGLPATARQNYPAVTGQGDTLAVAWQHNYGGADIHVMLTADAAMGLGTPDMLSDSGAADQTMPDIAFRNRRIHLVYVDNGLGSVVYRAGTVLPGTAVTDADAGSLQLWPNPSAGEVWLEMPAQGPVPVHVYDLHGRTVYSGQVQGRGLLPLTGLPAGLYTVQAGTAVRRLRLDHP